MTWISHRTIRLPCRCFYTKQMFVVYFLLQFFIAITKLSYGVILSYSKYTTTQPLFLPLNDNLIVLAARLTLNIFDRPILVWQKKNYYSNDFLRKKRKYSKRHFFMYVSSKKSDAKKMALMSWEKPIRMFILLFNIRTSSFRETIRTQKMIVVIFFSWSES